MHSGVVFHSLQTNPSMREIAPTALSTSVIICTYSDQRWDDLRRCLASLRTQHVPPDEVIVVVDHNPGLARRLLEHDPDVVVRDNTGPAGLSGARNTGLGAARGAIVAFIDDDATAAPDWLERITAGYRDDAVAAVGGSIAPIWPQHRPGWFPVEFDWVVGCSYRGLPETAAEVRNLIGCNMSFRRAALVGAGGFRSEMGRMGVDTAGCEETEACIRARHAGGRIVYRPDAMVSHRVSPGRASLRYFVQRCIGEGLSKSKVARLVGADAGLSSERAYSLRVLPTGALCALADAGRGDVWGLARAGMIVAGFACTAFGYVSGSVGTLTSSASAPDMEELSVPSDARV